MLMQEFEAELKQASSDDEKSTLDAQAGEGESVQKVECAHSLYSSLVAFHP